MISRTTTASVSEVASGMFESTHLIDRLTNFTGKLPSIVLISISICEGSNYYLIM